MREAPSLVLIEGLLARGAKVQVYDPEAMDEARLVLGDSVAYASTKEGAARGVDALVLVTEWHESEALNGPRSKLDASGNRFDGRNILSLNRCALWALSTTASVGLLEQADDPN